MHSPTLSKLTVTPTCPRDLVPSPTAIKHHVILPTNNNYAMNKLQQLKPSLSPAPAIPNDVPMDALELIRNRLSQTHQLLRKLADQINHHTRNPQRVKLPSYLSLLSQLQVLVTQLATLASQLDGNDDLLKLSNAYPLPSFPTTQHEGLATTLLRKKPLPDVDEWIDNAIRELELFKLPILKDDDFAEWCHSKIKELEDEFTFEGFHFESELQHLESEAGQKEQQEKQKELAEKQKEEAAVVSGSPLSPNQVLRFMSRGTLDI